VLRRGEPLGVLGQLHPGVRERFGMRTLDACLIELELERLAAQSRPVEDYHNPYEHEALLMDLNIVVPAALEADRLTEAVATAGGDLLRSVRLIDVYTGEHVAAGRKSVTFSLRFQIPERTLAQEEVLPVMELIRERLADEFGAALRT
jgi:phenylalanyl-tRNA synthetase beta chain